MCRRILVSRFQPRLYHRASCSGAPAYAYRCWAAARQYGSTEFAHTEIFAPPPCSSVRRQVQPSRKERRSGRVNDVEFISLAAPARSEFMRPRLHMAVPTYECCYPSRVRSRTTRQTGAMRRWEGGWSRGRREFGVGLSQGRRRRRDGVNSDLDLNRFRLEVYLHVVDTTARKRINEVLNGKRATVT